MKIFLLFISMIFSASFIQAQPVPPQREDSWKISLNKKIILISNESNELLITKKIKSTDWGKNGYLEINYKEADTGFWRRSFQLDDENGNQLFNKDSTTHVKIPTTVLRKLFTGKKEVKIYMVKSPLNPEILIRSQRVHLCTLKLP